MVPPSSKTQAHAEKVVKRGQAVFTICKKNWMFGIRNRQKLKTDSFCRARTAEKPIGTEDKAPPRTNWQQNKES